MARCFPFMPPECWRDGVAAAEPSAGSIKLQNGREDSKERKREKKRSKKERSKELHENLPPNKSDNKKRKYDERSQMHEKTDHCSKLAKSVTGQLEKSVLTEENGLPHSIPIPCDSSCSTQDSNKRRKLADPITSHNSSGLVLRIKLPQQKHRDAELPSTHKQSSLLQTHNSQKRDGSLLQDLNGPGPSSTRKPLEKHKDVELSSARRQSGFFQAHSLQKCDGLSERFPKGTGQSSTAEPCSPLLRRQQAVALPANTERPSFSGGIVKPTDKAAGSHFKPEKRNRTTNLDRVVEAPLLQRQQAVAPPVNTERPSFSAGIVKPTDKTAGSRFKPEKRSRTTILDRVVEGRHQAVHPPVNTGRPSFSGAIVKPTDEAAGSHFKPEKRSRTTNLDRVVEAPLLQRHQAVDPPVNTERPSFSGAIVKPTDETARSHSKSEKRSRRKDKEKKFRELVENWNPPPMLFEDPGGGEQDWLFGTTTRPASAVSVVKSCSVSTAEAPGHGDGGDASLLQPQAQYVPEFEMYVLPYVLPF